MARPRKDLEAARVLARVARTGESIVDAAKAEGVGKSLVYAEKARLASLPAPLARPAAPAEAALAVDEDPAVAVRKLVTSGAADAGFVARLAKTFCRPEAEVRSLLAAAAVQVGLDDLPAELAREESIAVARRARRRAEEMADWRTALQAQAHIDRIRGIGQPGATLPPGALSKDQVLMLLRRVATALEPWPDALAAFGEVIRVM